MTRTAIENKVSWNQKRKMILAIKNLYKNCFEIRCTESTDINNRLEYFCYMLWDKTSLGYTTNEKIELDSVLDVLRYALTLSNPSCINSAIHGLDHFQSYDSKQIFSIIENFLSDYKNNPNFDQQIYDVATDIQLDCLTQLNNN